QRLLLFTAAAFQIRQYHLNGDTTNKGGQKGAVNIFGSGEDEPHGNAMPAGRLPKTINFTPIEPGEKLFLPFRMQAVYFIQKQDPAIRGFKGTGFIAGRPGKSPFDVAKQVGGEQLWIAGVL